MSGTLEFWHDHLGVSVRDLEAAITWYRDVLRFGPFACDGEALRRDRQSDLVEYDALLKTLPMRLE